MTDPLTLRWIREVRPRRGIRWSLRHPDLGEIGCAFSLGHGRFHASRVQIKQAPSFEVTTGSMTASRRAIEKDLDRRSIAAFDLDAIAFTETA
jgi:hypothetical protein